MIINLVATDQDPAKSAAAYIASMKGLEAFTHQAARELSPHGIHVYAVKNTGDTITANIFALFE